MYIWIILAVVVIAVVCVCGVFFILSKKKKEGFKAAGRGGKGGGGGSGKSGKSSGGGTIAKGLAVLGGAFWMGNLLSDNDFTSKKRVKINKYDQYFVSFIIDRKIYRYNFKSLYTSSIPNGNDQKLVPSLPSYENNKKIYIEIQVMDGVELDLYTTNYMSDPLELTGRRIKVTDKPTAYNVFRIPAHKIGHISQMIIKNLD